MTFEDYGCKVLSRDILLVKASNVCFRDDSVMVPEYNDEGKVVHTANSMLVQLSRDHATLPRSATTGKSFEIEIIQFLDYFTNFFAGKKWIQGVENEELLLYISVDELICIWCSHLNGSW